MSIKILHSEDRSLIQLSDSITLGSAAELHRVLVEALGSGPSVAIHLECASELDVAAIQLLYAAWQAAKKSGVALTLEGPAPAPVKNAFLEAGLDPFGVISGVESLS